MPGIGDMFSTRSGSLGDRYINPGQPPWSHIKPTPSTASGVLAQRRSEIFYYCSICKRKHRTSSKIGKLHNE